MILFYFMCTDEYSGLIFLIIVQLRINFKYTETDKWKYCIFTN